MELTLQLHLPPHIVTTLGEMGINDEHAIKLLIEDYLDNEFGRNPYTWDEGFDNWINSDDFNDVLRTYKMGPHES